MPDSPRWCATCQTWGDHHTDKHDVANPLADGHYCRVCSTRLDSAERECPFGCKPARYNVGRMFCGQPGRFVGLAVIEGGCWNA